MHICGHFINHVRKQGITVVITYGFPLAITDEFGMVTMTLIDGHEA